MEEQKQHEIKRLNSLDALRGYSMFWVIGGTALFVALSQLIDWPIITWYANQLRHAEWNSFTIFDLYFPMFLFIAGISFPYSYFKRSQLLEKRRKIYLHIILRGIILVFLGIVYNNAFSLDYENYRYGSVLGHIGLAWMFAAFIFINSNNKYRIVWIIGILLFYWLLLLLFPATDLGSVDPFSKEGSLVGYIDRILLPGKLHLEIIDPEGILSIIPAVVTALSGMMAGQFILFSNHIKQVRKLVYLVIAAVVMILIGLLWSMFFPINKIVWSSSFVCLTNGISLLHFTLFYYIIDVLNYKKWAYFFTVIGVNSIAIYMVESLFISRIFNYLLLKLNLIIDKKFETLIYSIIYLSVCWVFLYFLYKRKIKVKV